jgi:hypothetical protein
MTEIVKGAMLWTQVGVHHHNSLLAIAETQILHIAWHATERRFDSMESCLKTCSSMRGSQHCTISLALVIQYNLILEVVYMNQIILDRIYIVLICTVTNS